MSNKKKITVGVLGVAIAAGSAGSGVSNGLGAGLSTFAVSLVIATVLWWIFME